MVPSGAVTLILRKRAAQLGQRGAIYPLSLKLSVQSKSRWPSISMRMRGPRTEMFSLYQSSGRIVPGLNQFL